MKYYIRTFGCQQNIADSERLASYYQSRGYRRTANVSDADLAVINTCMIRQKSEDKVYGLLKNLKKIKDSKKEFKIILTGCIVGAAIRDTTGKALRTLQRRLPVIDEFLPAEKIGFEYESTRHDAPHAWVPISNGCNNFCTYCVVPFARGREISRPLAEVLAEIKNLAKKGYTHITLLGQNVNSYGNNLLKSKNKFILPNGKKVKPVMVKHLGRFRIPTLFPFLLEEICAIKGIKKISFISANPWDFSDELISVMKKYKHIDRVIHLPVQSGNNIVLRRMNRWYTRQQYLALLKKIKKHIPEAQFTTDIIVGFPGETKLAFHDTVRLAREAKFIKAFVATYSPRPYTVAIKKYPDTVAPEEKKKRYRELDALINHKYTGYIPAWLRPAD
jgi:tRNA-2-methylthio-N6-dimethylallyladenosine synthase